VDSDAHTSAQLRYARIGLAHARLAQLPADRILNCWPVKDILKWAQGRRGPGRRRRPR